MSLHTMTLTEAHGLLRDKKISSRELTEAVLARIDEVDPKVGAYITVDQTGALAAADAADARLAKGEASTLTGLPVGLKDLLCTQGLKTTCASKMLEHFVPPYDATVVTQLREAGAVFPGKLNMDEFAMGSTTEHSALQTTQNPWDLSRVPGGSSGGSAAAVAADLCLAALGSDTGGSIRQPASHCGIVGMKPTYGRVSRYGLVAFASSLDQIGPMTKSVEDSALLMETISGYDPRDSTSVPKEVPDYRRLMKDEEGKGLAGMTVGLPVEYWQADGVDPEVMAAVTQAKATLESLGARCVSVSLPHTEYAVAAYYVIAPSEASSNLARYDGVRYGMSQRGGDGLLSLYKNTRSEGFGDEVKRRIIIGTYALSSGYYDAYYKKASQVRTLIVEDFKTAFQSCDFIISPVAPSPAGKKGESADDPLKMYLSDLFTLSANLAGIPGMSVPCGLTRQGLPVGLQLLGRHFDEATLLKAAWHFERTAGFQGQRPPL
ncbi:Asp-tRNA(Asn)/Glu-tRNA(Gln) amidotransferase subunit GatA [Desulfoluna sp.]|uniref:Asp-tRNA(Asn)/Glu-tRNA(Gln) amidotransferase subunit GatA n=1 Tax=Desulfoluna sp. TaxID=2045199 RepID=UPI00262E4907|nr:Asp-tRNA(Asn)/Glu-tRNA(Gln) amidotransferase subunit GatA [Desulfoluna sp.]